MAKKNAFNTVTTFSKITALVLFVMLPVCAFFLGVAYQEKLDRPFLQDFVISKPIKPTEHKACSMLAKQCPDGSYVSQSGPKCEFTQCPGSK